MLSGGQIASQPAEHTYSVDSAAAAEEVLVRIAQAAFAGVVAEASCPFGCMVQVAAVVAVEDMVAVHLERWDWESTC